MAGRGVEFSFVLDIRIRLDTRDDISNSITPTTTKIDKRLHLEELTHVRLIKVGATSDVITFKSRDYKKML